MRGPRLASTGSVRSAALVACAVGAQLVALQLVLRTPFTNDDSPNQTIRGYIDQHHQTFWSFLGSIISAQYHGLGRFMPVGLFENYGLQYVLHDRVVYKLLLIVVSIVATLLVARLLVVLSVPVEIAVLGAALTSVLFQLHNYHDSLVAYAGLLQLITIAFSGSVLLFVGYLRRGGWWRLALSLLLVVLADLTYEAAYLLCVLHVAAAYAEGRRLRTAVAPVAVSGLFVVMTIVLRHSSGQGGGSQYSINLAPGDVLSTLARQLSAALPGTNFLDPQGPRLWGPSNSHTPELRGLLIGLLLLPVLYAAARAARGWRPPGRLIAGMLGLCGAFLLLPAGLVSLAPGYQRDIRWGVGYLPVFVEVIAVGVLGALLYSGAARRVPAVPLALVCAALAGVGASRNAEGSTRLVAVQLPVANARDQLEDGFRHGILDGVPRDGLLLMDQVQISPPNGPWIAGYNWDPGNWIYTHITRRYRTLPMAGAAPSARQCQDGSGAAAPCQVVQGPVTWFTTGAVAGNRWVVMTPLDPSLRLTGKTDLYVAPGGRTARLALRSTSAGTIARTAVSWSAQDGSQLMTPPSALRATRTSGRWTMLDVPVPRGARAGSAAAVVAPGAP